MFIIENNLDLTFPIVNILQVGFNTYYCWQGTINISAEIDLRANEKVRNLNRQNFM
jgi:hypothetical protein